MSTSTATVATENEGVPVIIIDPDRAGALVFLRSEDDGTQFLSIRDGALPWEDVERLREILGRVGPPKPAWIKFYNKAGVSR